MQFTNIYITNFRSFNRAEAELSSFNVLIGPNAAGKSNFLQTLKFFRDIVQNGLENAISMQGGIEYLRNINLPKTRNNIELGFSLKIFREYGIRRETKAGLIEAKLSNFEYTFGIKYNKHSNGYHIIKDILNADFHIVGYDASGRKIVSDYGEGRLRIVFSKNTTKISYKSSKKLNFNWEELFPILPDTRKFLSEKQPYALILESPLFYMFPFEKISNYIRNITIYDFDSRLPKKATQLIGKAELEENGENIAIVLRKILADEGKKRMLFNLVRDALPFIENIMVQKLFDKYLQFMIKESYSSSEKIPSSLMSDGTVFIIAMIIAIYFENKTIAVFEEPERRIHPYLISKIINMMKDASLHKQIIISTHNPEAVKHTDINDLLLISRDEKGFSIISRPAEKEEIKVFLENEIGIEELYVQNLLSN